jgi:hypothetical protein
MGQIYQITTNFTKRQKITPNHRKTSQMVMKYTKTFHSKAPQNLPKLGFLFENNPSGNLGE